MYLLVNENNCVKNNHLLYCNIADSTRHHNITMLRPVVILIIHQIVNLRLKTHLLNDKRKSMDLVSWFMFDIMENLCINLHIMKNYMYNILFRA